MNPEEGKPEQKTGAFYTETRRPETQNQNLPPTRSLFVTKTRILPKIERTTVPQLTVKPSAPQATVSIPDKPVETQVRNRSAETMMNLGTQIANRNKDNLTATGLAFGATLGGEGNDRESATAILQNSYIIHDRGSKEQRQGVVLMLTLDGHFIGTVASIEEYLRDPKNREIVIVHPKTQNQYPAQIFEYSIKADIFIGKFNNGNPAAPLPILLAEDCCEGEGIYVANAHEEVCEGKITRIEKYSNKKKRIETDISMEGIDFGFPGWRQETGELLGLVSGDSRQQFICLTTPWDLLAMHRKMSQKILKHLLDKYFKNLC